MKVATRLNNIGRARAEAFLLKHDKNTDLTAYNMKAAIDFMSIKVCESDNMHYELSGIYTASNNSVTISFTDDELDFQEIED